MRVPKSERERGGNDQRTDLELKSDSSQEKRQ